MLRRKEWRGCAAGNDERRRKNARKRCGGMFATPSHRALNTLTVWDVNLIYRTYGEEGWGEKSIV